MPFQEIFFAKGQGAFRQADSQTSVQINTLNKETGTNVGVVVRRVVIRVKIEQACIRTVTPITANISHPNTDVPFGNDGG